MKTFSSRREFLATATALPFLAACGCGADPASPASPSSSSTASAQSLFRQDFNAAAVGVYGPDALAAGWMGASPYNGVREGRVTVFDGPDARVDFDQFVIATARV